MHRLAKLSIAGLLLLSVLPAQKEIQQEGRKAQKQQKAKKGRAVRAARLVPMQRRKPKTQAELIALKKAKLEGAWLEKAPWLLDFDAAKAEAKKSGKPIFVYFTRSYAY